MKELWEAFVSWIEVYSRARAAQVLYNQGLVEEARQLMLTDFSKERK
jgi:hypothetical protein